MPKDLQWLTGAIAVGIVWVYSRIQAKSLVLRQRRRHEKTAGATDADRRVS